MNRTLVDQHRFRNQLHSIVLFGGLVGLLGLVGYLLLGSGGLLLGCLIATLTVALQHSIPTEWLLRMHGARRMDASRSPRLIRILQTLLDRANLDCPVTLYYVPSHTLNAFTMGNQSKAIVAVTTGILQQLDERDIAAILAHEISHIKHRDISINTLAATIVSMTRSLSLVAAACAVLFFPSWMSSGEMASWVLLLFIALIAPALSVLLQMALSRTREFDADLSAAELLGDPQGLISALTKLEQPHRGPWYNSYYQVLRNPGQQLLSSHPATADRIARLRSLRGNREPRETPAASNHCSESFVYLTTFQPRALTPLQMPRSICAGCATAGRFRRWHQDLPYCRFQQCPQGGADGFHPPG